jgi:peptide/nickel transport system permease protein
MAQYIAKRLVIGILVMVVLSIVTFFLTNVASDPARAIAGANATAEDVESIRQSYGFDRPLTDRYFDWLAGVVQGDLGVSYRERRPVISIIAERLPVTLQLGLISFLVALLLSVPLGIWAALRQNSWIDRSVLGLALIGQAMPTFWLALIGIVVFSVNLRWLPVSGSGTWKHFVMPSVVLALYALPVLLRLTRAGMIEVLQSDFIRTARAKGLKPHTVIFKHALRNAVLPLVAVAAVQLGYLLGGSAIIETIFAMRGVGFLAWESIKAADMPIVQAIVLVMSVIYVVLTTIADIINGWLDPRLRAN